MPNKRITVLNTSSYHNSRTEHQPLERKAALVEHLEVLCEKIGMISIPSDLNISTQNEAAKSYALLSDLHLQVKQYRGILESIVSGLEQEGEIRNNSSFIN